LNVSGFKLRRTIEFDPKFMDPEYPFRWAGVYHLTGGILRPTASWRSVPQGEDGYAVAS
jgi:hypothetical protein